VAFLLDLFADLWHNYYMIFEVGDMIAHKTSTDDVYLILEHYWFEGTKDYSLPSQWMYRLLRLEDGQYYKYPESTISTLSVRIA